MFESLERRAMLTGDALTESSSVALYGDANLDGAFNSSDLVQVFQAGKYESLLDAEWGEGDWNFDGLFDSKDLVGALQQGAYLGGPAAAQKAIPFKGDLTATETYDIQGATLFVDASGAGNATHLGLFSVTYESEVDLATLSGHGSAHFVAANGDSLFAEVVGQATPTSDPNVLSIVEVFTITGGTGRFTGATGSITVERVLDAGATSGSFDGTILIAEKM
jgi:hypothetical protein